MDRVFFSEDFANLVNTHLERYFVLTPEKEWTKTFFSESERESFVPAIIREPFCIGYDQIRYVRGSVQEKLRVLYSLYTKGVSETNAAEIVGDEVVPAVAAAYALFDLWTSDPPVKLLPCDTRLKFRDLLHRYLATTPVQQWGDLLTEKEKDRWVNWLEHAAEEGTGRDSDNANDNGWDDLIVFEGYLANLMDPAFQHFLACLQEGSTPKWRPAILSRLDMEKMSAMFADWRNELNLGEVHTPLSEMESETIKKALNVELNEVEEAYFIKRIEKYVDHASTCDLRKLLTADGIRSIEETVKELTTLKNCEYICNYRQAYYQGVVESEMEFCSKLYLRKMEPMVANRVLGCKTDVNAVYRLFDEWKAEMG